jgi:hypothetical protein
MDAVMVLTTIDHNVIDIPRQLIVLIAALREIFNDFE